MRKLATIRLIDSINPHPNADLLDIATVDGWQCVVAKGKHKAGEKVVYFEIDSVLPIKPHLEFLRKGCYIKKDWLPDGEGFRIKTIKLRKELSQGLVMSLEDLGLEYRVQTGGQDFEVGEDWTEALGVIKYDPPIPAQLRGMAKGNFPSFIPKTDQNRIQNVHKRLMRSIRDKELTNSWEVTTKLEGSSMTVYYHEGKWGVCSRNIDLKLEDNENSYVKKFHDLLNNTKLSKLEQFANSYAIQGELMGPGIQGNIENFKGFEFFVYDVYDISLGEYLCPRDRRAFMESLGLQHVPVLFKHMSTVNVFELTWLLELSEGTSINAKRREGLVFKNTEDPSISFKVINNDYLLKGAK